MMAKKKDASTGSADASGLRRSGRETASRKSERLETQTSPNPSSVKNVPEKVEKPTGSSPLRRSDRGKKSVETSELPDTKSTTKEKTSSKLKPSSEEVNEGTETEKQDADAGIRKRKKWDAKSYKAMFKSQRTKVESDVDKEPKNQNSIRVQESVDKALLEGRVIDLDETECGDCPQTKSPDGRKSIESDDEEKNNGVHVSLSNGNIADSDNHRCQTSQQRFEHDLENQQELDTCHKENAENNDVSSNTQNSKFIEFWVPVRISNVQLEQYCATLLSNDILRSTSKNDKLGTLDKLFKTNRAICNHPYTVDHNLENSLAMDKTRIVQVGKEVSGKFWFLDHILPEIQKRQLRVLILFQPPTAGLDVPLRHLLVEFINQRFGEESYVHVDSKKQAANNLNKDKNRFIFLIDSRSCNKSVKLSSVDTIIIFDSEVNPSVDLKSLQKLSIDSPLDQIVIFRLYCSSTLEEKILKLAENNVAVDFRSPSLRSNYDPLLMWGASDLFDRLTKFHSQTGLNISSEDSFLKDVVNEFLYVLSHKCKSNDTSLKLISTRIVNCGIYGKSTSLHSEVKTHLNDGDPPYIFWKKLLDEQSPAWKFVSESTPRQRKRSRPIFDSPPADDGVVKTRRKTVNINSTVEPAQANDESHTSSGDTFWSVSTKGDRREEDCTLREARRSTWSKDDVLDNLKLTVSKLCNILKFSEDAKSTVVTFLEFVCKHYQVLDKVNKDHGSLHGFLLSLCWICSSIGENETDRSESFALAKQHLNFICKENVAETVYEKLKPVKQRFLEGTKTLPALKDSVPAPEGVKVGIEKSQHATNVDPANKIVEMIEKINREWDEKRVSLETDYKVEKNIIIALYHSNLSMRSGKLIMKEREFAYNLEELERLKEIRLKELNDISLQGSRNETGNAEVAPTVEVERDDEVACEGVICTESTGSHAAVSSEQTGEVPAQQVGDEMEDDVAEKVDSGFGNSKGGSSSPDVSCAGEDFNETGADDVAPRVDFRDVETPVGNCVKESDENGHNETDTNDVAPHVDSGDVEMPAGETGANDMAPHVSSGDRETPAGKSDHIETGANDMEPLVGSGDVEMPAGNDDKENDKDETVGHDENDHNETVDDVEVPAGNDDKENDKDGTVGHDENYHNETIDHVEVPAGNCNKDNNDGIVGIDASHADKDRHESVDDVSSEVKYAEMETPAVDDVATEVESAEMETPAGTCDEEDAEEGEILPDTPDGGNHNQSSPNDVLPRVEPAEMATPADNEDHSGSSSNNPVCAATSQDKTPSPASDHEIQNDPLQVEQILDTGVQDEEINVPNQPDQIISEVEPVMLPSIGVVQDKEVNTVNLQPSGADQLDQIIPHNEHDPAVVENPSDTVQHDQIIQDVEPDMLPITSVVQDEVNVSTLQPSGAGQLDQIIQDDEQVLTVAENPSDTFPQTGLLLESDREEPNLIVTQSGENIEENPVSVSASVSVSVSVPATETEQQPSLVATSVAPAPLTNALNMFDNVANRVMPQIINQTDPLQAEVERLSIARDAVAKFCQDLKQKLNIECEKEIEEVVAQIRLKYEARQQQVDTGYKLKNTELETNIKRVNMNKILAEAFRSKCQDLTPSAHPGIQGSQAEILLRQLSGTSSTMHYHGASSSAGQSLGNHQSPQPQPLPPPQQPQLRPQPPLQIVHQPSALFSTTVSRPPSATPSRPPSPVVNQLTLPRQPPIRLPSIVSQATSATTTTTTRLPTTTRPPPPGFNMNGSSSFHNRPPTGLMDMFAANLRISTETRAQSPHPWPLNETRAPAVTPHVRPLVINETRAPTATPHIRPLVIETRASSPHIRPLVINETRAPAPHQRPVEARAPAPHLRSRAATEIRARAPHMQPYRPTHSVSPVVVTHQRVSPTQNITGGPPAPPPLPSDTEVAEITDLTGEGTTAHGSSAPDLVCLSDDD